jgi:hypothetical protein
MVPINMDEEKFHYSTNTLNQTKGSFSFTYLGLPLGLTNPSLEYICVLDTESLEKTCEIADSLTYGRKLELVKSVLSFVSIFLMYCLDVPITITK